MSRFLRCTWLGLTNLPGYGYHPGTPALLLMVISGALIAGERDWRNGVIAAGATLLVFGPIYLAGAYQRGDEYLRRSDGREVSHSQS